MVEKQIAELIDGIQYGEDIPEYAIELAKMNKIVIAFGYSDDCLELRGAIHDEYGCYGGDTFYIDSTGVVDKKTDECENCKYFMRAIEKSIMLEIDWTGNEGECTWKLSTDIRSESFFVLEDDEKYCKGVIFSLKQLEVKASEAQDE